jgi:hypothetical protein
MEETLGSHARRPAAAATPATLARGAARTSRRIFDTRSDLLAAIPWPGHRGRCVCGPLYHDEVSSQDEGWRRPDYPPWSGEPVVGPDILGQGSDRPPIRHRPAVRWRRPPTVAIILGAAGLLVGLAAGYAAGTLHAGKATASSAQSGATASPTTISPVLIAGASSQFQMQCSATGMLRQLDASTAHGTVIMIFPSAGPKLICRQ